MIEGSDYKLSRMDVVRYVDENYPHAEVSVDGRWHAADNPFDNALTTVTPISGPVAVFASDRAYYPGLAAALTSFRRYHPDTHMVVLDRGLSLQQVAYLRQFAEVRPSDSALPKDPVWARLELSLLPYERIVYLDSDVIVCKRLDALLDTTAEFAAARNLDWKVTENFRVPNVVEQFGISPNAPAFNSGVFSIDNRKWGGGRLLAEGERLYREVGETFLYSDQSALQIIMHSRQCVTFLDDSYNAIDEFWDWKHRADDVHVIHFAGNEIKPWDPRCRYPGLKYFFANSKIVRDGL